MRCDLTICHPGKLRTHLELQGHKFEDSVAFTAEDREKVRQHRHSPPGRAQAEG
jgi:hypothetical protein